MAFHKFYYFYTPLPPIYVHTIDLRKLAKSCFWLIGLILFESIYINVGDGENIWHIISSDRGVFLGGYQRPLGPAQNPGMTAAVLATLPTLFACG